ncbi:MAG: hypothetical protein ABJN69_06190 [Hellea sp.]
MNETKDIEISQPEIQNVETKPRKRFGAPLLLGAAFLASAFGAGAMYVAAELRKTPAPDLTPLTVSIDKLSADNKMLKADNKSLKAQLTRLQRDIKAASNPAVVDLSGVESRLDRLEAAEPQALYPDLIARLEALKEDGSEALDLSDILTRLEALEARPVLVASAPVETAIIMPQPIENIAFPEAKILAVLDKAEASQGWLKKSLNKHISVQSEGNPRFLVELVIKNIEAENFDAAIAAFDKLPAEAKAVATDWRKNIESN